jgi:hypothetical protein
MGESFDCVSRDVLGIDELEAHWVLWKERLPSFKSQIGKFPDTAFLHPKVVIPTLSNYPGIQVSSVRVQGYIPSKMDTKEAFREVFHKGAKTIGVAGGLMCSVGFEEINSRQSKRAYDTLSVAIAKGRRFFSYCANGSKVMNDPVYRQYFIEDLLRRLTLPVRIKVAGGYFYLVHENPIMELQLLMAGLDGRSPCSFSCQVEWGEDILVEKIFEVLPMISTKKRFEVHWTASSMDELPSPEECDKGIRIFLEQIVQCELPAKEFFVDLGFRIQDLAGVEALRHLCDQHDVCHVALYTFAIGKEFVRILAEIKAEGYRLLFECPMTVDVTWLSEVLGLPFQEKGHRVSDN